MYSQLILPLFWGWYLKVQGKLSKNLSPDCNKIVILFPVRHPQAGKSCSSLLSGVREGVQSGNRADRGSLGMLCSVLVPCAHYIFDLLFQICKIQFIEA